MSGSCSQCRSQTLTRDDITGHLLCSDCGLLQDFDSFDAQITSISSAAAGTFIRLGTAGTGTVYSYHDSKRRQASCVVDDVALRLGLSAAKSSAVKSLASDVTADEFGTGRWFPILVAACAYVVMRSDCRPLPLSDAAAAVSADEHELGRMIRRVVDHLELRELPDVDVVALLERALRTSSLFSGAGDEKMERMREQGVFLVQCMVKWSLSTGRRPVPLVAAVLAFVGEVNDVVGATIRALARELRAKLCTCQLRYRELLRALVGVARALPWGENVNVRNVAKNAPFVIQLMEKRSMLSRVCGPVDEDARFDLGNVVGECLKKDMIFETFGTQMVVKKKVDGFQKLVISPECLAVMYENVVRHGRGGEALHRREESGFELERCSEWWEGKSELSKKLLLKEIVEKDVGFDAPPPSFRANRAARKARREKIGAAKRRIKRIMAPSEEGAVVGAIGWEDLIIETLLLHGVKDEEIKTGQYNRLMDLYVFNY